MGNTMESTIIIFSFILAGLTVGFFTFLIFRMGMHQLRFKLAGSLFIVTTLAGGGFITFLSAPLHFASFSLGYFMGVVAYILYLRLRSVRFHSMNFSEPDGSRATINEVVSEVVKDVVARDSKRWLRTPADDYPFL